MELRRALFFFAIVLGLAAIATPFSRPDRDGDEQASTPVAPPPADGADAGATGAGGADAGAGGPAGGAPSASPRPGPRRPLRVSFSTGAKPQTERLAAGRAATVKVEVPKPGRVDLAGLGLTASADPLTPARFDVLERRPGRHEVRFSPAGGGEARTLGTLQIVR